MEHKENRENQASNLKKILADINAQEKARNSLLSDDDYNIESVDSPLLNNQNEQQHKETVSTNENNSNIISNDNELEQTNSNNSNQNDLNKKKKESEDNDIKEVHVINNENDKLKTVTTLHGENHDYVPFGHYEEVTNNSEDVVYYDSEQFRQYVQRQKKSQSEIDDSGSQGKINKKILEHNALLDDQYAEENIQEISIENLGENNTVQFNEQEINTLNLPPRREVHRKTSRKLTFHVNQPLIRFSLIVILTSITIIYLFLIGTDELLELYELKSLFNWF